MNQFYPGLSLATVCSWEARGFVRKNKAVGWLLVWEARSWGRAPCFSLPLALGPQTRRLCLGLLSPMAHESHMFVRVLAEGFFPPSFLASIVYSVEANSRD